MRRILFLLTFALGIHAQAGTQILFSKDGSKVTVLMLAVTSNPDAVSFNEAMAVDPEDINGKYSKKIDFTEDNGTHAFNGVCVFSKLVGTTGSCTLVFQTAAKALFDSSLQSIDYRLEGEEAKRMAALFVLPQTGNEIYRSSDDKLRITFERAIEREGDAVSSFTLQYGAP